MNMNISEEIKGRINNINLNEEKGEKEGEK